MSQKLGRRRKVASTWLSGICGPAQADEQYATEDEPRERTDGHPQRIERERAAALFARDIVGDQAVRRRGAARLADADADAREQQFGEIAREAAERGEAAPHRERDGDHADAVAAIGQSASPRSAFIGSTRIVTIWRSSMLKA